MNEIINPYRELSANITDKEFEEFCMETLKAFSKKENMENFSICSNQHFAVADGTYQIDIVFEYTIMNIKNRVLVECKKYKRSVERKVVAELRDKVNSIGANKGIVMSTSGFQSGAVEYAKAHGITLIQCIDKYVRFIQASLKPIDALRIEYMQIYPKYCFYEWDLERDFIGDQIYPTKEIEEELRRELMTKIEKERGLIYGK